MTFFYHLLVLSLLLLLSCTEDKKPSQGNNSSLLEEAKTKEEAATSIMPTTVPEPDEKRKKQGRITNRKKVSSDHLSRDSSPKIGKAEKTPLDRQALKLGGTNLISPRTSPDKHGSEKRRNKDEPKLPTIEPKQTDTRASFGIGKTFPPPPLITSRKAFSGTKKETFADGTLKVESHYIEGKKYGSYTSWYETGRMQKKGWMKNDKWHGTYQEWWSEGTLRVRGNYIEGMQNGPWRFFNKDGESLPTLYFDNGQEVTRDLKILRR